jgi:hypothetical protein
MRSSVPNCTSTIWDTTVAIQPQDCSAKGCLIVALEAFALDFVSSADRTHYTVFRVCTKAALVDSPVHKAEMAALALLVTMADNRAVVADSRAAAGSVR